MQQENYLDQIISTRSVQNPLADARINHRPHRNISYAADGHRASYVQLQNASQSCYGDTVSALCNTQIPNDIAFYYFEVKIHKKLEQRGKISVGLADSLFPMNQQLGATRRSLGYLSDGKCLRCKMETDVALEPYKEENIVGVGVNLIRREVFFTLDGVRFEKTFECPSDEMFPAVTMYGEASIEFNFGKSSFKYDTSNIFRKEKAKMVQEIAEEEVSPYSLHLIVQEYLWSQGYLRTLKTFENESLLEENEQKQQMKVAQSQNSIPLEMKYDDEAHFDSDEKVRKKSKNDLLQLTPMTSLQRKLSGLQSPNFTQLSIERKTSGFQLDEYQNGDNNLNDVAEEAFLKNSIVNEERQRIHQLIREGKIEEARKQLEALRPSYLRRPGVLPALCGQQFIELIKERRFHEAVKFGTEQLKGFTMESIECVNEKGQPMKMQVKQLMELICYNNPEESGLRGLLSQEQRERVCDYINRTLLLEMGYEDESALEICLKQLVQVCEEATKRGLFAGDTFQFAV